MILSFLRVIVILFLSSCAILPISPESIVRKPEERRPYRLGVAAPVVPAESAISEDGVFYRPAMKASDVAEVIKAGLAGAFRATFEPEVLAGQDTDDPAGDIHLVGPADEARAGYLYRLKIDSYVVA